MPKSHAAWEGQAETAAAVFPVHQQKMETMTHKELVEEFRITDTLTNLQLDKLVSICNRIVGDERKKAWLEGYEEAMRIYVEYGEVEMTKVLAELKSFES